MCAIGKPTYTQSFLPFLRSNTCTNHQTPTTCRRYAIYLATHAYNLLRALHISLHTHHLHKLIPFCPPCHHPCMHKPTHYTVHELSTHQTCLHLLQHSPYTMPPLHFTLIRLCFHIHAISHYLPPPPFPLPPGSLILLFPHILPTILLVL